MKLVFLASLLALLAGCSVADAVPLQTAHSAAEIDAPQAGMPAPQQPFDEPSIGPRETVGASTSE